MTPVVRRFVLIGAVVAAMFLGAAARQGSG